MKNTYTIYYQDNFFWISPIIAKEFNLTNGQRVYSEELFLTILKRNTEYNILALEALADKSKLS